MSAAMLQPARGRPHSLILVLLHFLLVLMTEVTAKAKPSSIALNPKSDDLTNPITSISVNSAVLPRGALRDAARASGIHAAKPSPDATIRLAEHINAWYRRNGYVFARVVDRTQIRGGKLRLIVSEPVVAPTPVAMQFYAAARNGDEEPSKAAKDGASSSPSSTDAAARPQPLLVRRQRQLQARAALSLAMLRPLPKEAASSSERVVKFEGLLDAARRNGVEQASVSAAERRLHELRRRAGLPSLGLLERMHAAGDMMYVGGSTRPAVVAHALNLKPGEPFRWDPNAWERLRRCGLFEEAEARAKFAPPPPPRIERKKLPVPAAVFIDQGVRRGSQVSAANEDGRLQMATAAAAPQLPPPRPPRPRHEEQVEVSLAVVEKDSRARKPGQHCRVEPGIGLAGGRLTGEVSVTDHNLLGRNQNLRLDITVKNHSEFRASLRDPRLGRRFGFNAKVFQRGPALPKLGGGSSSDEDAATESASEAAAASAGRPEPTGGADFSFNGPVMPGTSLGFGASAEVVPTATTTGGGKTAKAPKRQRDTPLLLNANLGFGSLQSGVDRQEAAGLGARGLHDVRR